MKKYRNILAVGLSGIVVYVFDKIWGDQINWKEFREFDIGEFLSTSITIFNILIFSILFLVIYLIQKKIFDKGSLYRKKEKKLRKFDNLTEKETGIRFRWKVYFSFNGDPFISDLDAFCTKHPGPPIKLVHGRCPVSGCNNNRQPTNLLSAENYIESDLINRWDKIKS